MQRPAGWELSIHTEADHQFHLSGTSGGLNGSTQHLSEVYSQEAESLRFSSGVDFSAALLYPDPTGYGTLRPARVEAYRWFSASETSLAFSRGPITFASVRGFIKRRSLT